MSNRSVKNFQLTPNTSFYVQGELGFARIMSQIAGDELRKSDERRTAHGWMPIGKPYTTATVHNARVLMKNPQNPTPEEIYAQESLYKSKDNARGYSYTCNNKGKFLPWVGVRNTDNGSVDQIMPEGELASGLKVTLCMRIFSVRNHMNKGVTLDGIIVEEPIRYYNNNQTSARLADSGIVFHPDPNAEALRYINNNSSDAVNNNSQPAPDEFDSNVFQEMPMIPNPYNNPPQNVANPQPNIPTQPMNTRKTQFSNPGICFNPDGTNNNVNTGNRNY